MIRRSFWRSFTIIGLAIFYSIFSFIPTFATPDAATLDFYDANNILYYDPTGGNECGTDSPGLAVGNDNEAKVWNWFATANIAGVSNNPAIIAGIMGNLQQEHNFKTDIDNPNATPFGIAQWTDGRKTSILDKLNAAGATTDDEALPIELEFLTTESQFTSFQEQLDKLDYTSGEDGVKSASDLFLVLVERAMNLDEPKPSDALVDSYAQKVGDDLGYHYWQEAEQRRNYGIAIYQKYANSTPTTNNNKSTGSDVTIIGNDIIVTATDEIKKILPEADINAANNRKFSDTKDLITENLRETVVIATSSNDSTIKKDDADKLINAIGKNHNIILVNNYSTEPNNQINTLFKSLASTNSNIVVADWATAAGADPGKYIKDNKPTAEGNTLLAQTIVNAITSSSKKTSNTTACSTNNSPYTGEGIPQYNQCDAKWRDSSFGSSTVCQAGCGPTSFAMMATALLGQSILPDEVAAASGNFYVQGQGSAWGITSYLASKYNLLYKKIDTNGNCRAAIDQALDEGWMIHTSGNSGASSGLFGNGHYIGITGKNANGEWYVADSATRSSSGGKFGSNRYYPPEVVLSQGLYCNNVHGIKK